MDEYFREYGLIAIFAVIAFVVPATMLMASWATSKLGIRPNNPTPVKLETYECGMEALGGRWVQFNFRYYMYAVLFVIFDVEVVFLYPWAVTFAKLQPKSPEAMLFLGRILFFIATSIVAYVYAWRKGVFRWD